MRRALLVVGIAAALSLGLGACSSSGSEGTGSTERTTTTAGAKTAAEEQAAAEARTNAAVAARCSTDLRTIQTGVAAYEAVNGEEPSTVADLVPDLLREAPEEWELGPPGPDGSPTVVPNEVGVAAGCRADG